MLSVAVKSNKELEVTRIVPPEVEEDAVIVKVHFSGLCGSDLPRIFFDGAHFYPIVLGHEFSERSLKLAVLLLILMLGSA